MTDLTLIDVVPDWLTDGIFSKMQITEEWFSGFELDFLYFGGHSGNKLISPLVQKIIVDGKLTTAGQFQIANVAKFRYLKKWNEIYKTFNIVDYTQNIKVSETRTPDLQKTDSVSENFAETEKRSVALDRTDDSETTSFGFNSVTGTPSGKQHRGTTADPTKNYENVTRGQTGDKIEKRTGTEKTERSGTVGKSPSQLAEEYRATFLKDLYEIIFSDMDNLLTLKIY